MGWRFRKTLTLLPGIRLNISKGGASLSLGRKGVSFNIGKKGTRTTLGLPGTGISHSTYKPFSRGSAALRWAMFALAAAVILGSLIVRAGAF